MDIKLHINWIVSLADTEQTHTLDTLPITYGLFWKPHNAIRTNNIKYDNFTVIVKQNTEFRGQHINWFFNKEKRVLWKSQVKQHIVMLYW